MVLEMDHVMKELLLNMELFITEQKKKKNQQEELNHSCPEALFKNRLTRRDTKIDRNTRSQLGCYSLCIREQYDGKMLP